MNKYTREEVEKTVLSIRKLNDTLSEKIKKPEDIYAMYHLISSSARNSLSFIFKDLSNLDLSGLDLKRIDFQNANLENVNLENADLSFANLKYVNLKRSNLTNANFEKADLQRADLSYSAVKGASFQGANLKYIEFRPLDFYGDFENFDKPQTSWEDMSLENLKKRGAII